MISHDDAMAAVDRLECLAFFSQITVNGRAEIADVLMKLVNDPVRRFRPGYYIDDEYFPGDPIPYVTPKDRLEWLITAQVNRVGTWHGPLELRAFYCLKFTPADGVVVASEISDYAGVDVDFVQNYVLPEPRDSVVDLAIKGAVEKKRIRR